MNKGFAILFFLFIWNAECQDPPVDLPVDLPVDPAVTLPVTVGLPVATVLPQNITKLDALVGAMESLVGGATDDKTVSDLLPEEMIETLDVLFKGVCKMLYNKNGVRWMKNGDIFPHCVSCPDVIGKANNVKCKKCIPTCYNPLGKGVCSQDCNKDCMCKEKYYISGDECLTWSKCKEATTECPLGTECGDDESCVTVTDPETEKPYKLCVPKSQIPGPEVNATNTSPGVALPGVTVPTVASVPAVSVAGITVPTVDGGSGGATTGAAGAGGAATPAK